MLASSTRPTPAPGGRVFLVGPDVENTGIIRTPQGQIVLAAGSSVDLVQESSPFVTVKVTASNEQALNMGSLISDSGRIDMGGALVRNTGVIAANSAVVGANGEIRLVATKDVTLDAGSSTTANGPSGGKVLIQAQTGTALVYGNVSATGSSGTGGTVQALGVRVGVLGNGVIDASGATGGGTVLVGGDQHGANPNVQNAQQTLVGPDGIIRADAGTTGDGGRVIVWSDDYTQFYGNISARGGSQSGNGGFVETSGKQNLEFAGVVDTRAPFGTMGTLLLDPAEITITHGAPPDTNITVTGTFTDSASSPPATLTDSTINTQLGSNSVVVTTSTGDILIDTTGVAIGPATANSNSLTLQSGAAINWSSNWSYTNNGALNLNAATSVSGGNTSPGTLTLGLASPLSITAVDSIVNVPIVANGGSVSMSSSSGAISSGGFDITTGGGAVVLNGTFGVQVGNIDTTVAGAGISPTDTAVSITTGNGRITTGAITTGNSSYGNAYVSITSGSSSNGSVTTGNILTGNASDTHVSIFYGSGTGLGGGIQTGTITTGNAGFDSSVNLQTGGSITTGSIQTGSTSFYAATSSVTLFAGLGVTTQNISTGSSTSGRSFVQLETNQGGISAGTVQTAASIVSGGGNSSFYGEAGSGNIGIGSITTGASDRDSYVWLTTSSGSITTGAISTGNAGTTSICCGYRGSSVELDAFSGNIQTGAIQTGTAIAGGGTQSSSFIYLNASSGSVSTTGGSLKTGNTVDGGEGNVVINAGTGVQTGNITTGTTNGGSSATGLSNVSISTSTGGVITGTIVTGSGGNSDAVSINADSITTQNITTASTAYGQSFIFLVANSGDINAGAVTSGNAPSSSYIILLAPSGNVTTGNVQAGNTGAGGEGNVNIFAGGGNINTGSITTGGGGNQSFIDLDASGNVTTNGGALRTGNTADGGEGNVVIFAGSGVSTGSITTGTTNASGTSLGLSNVSIFNNSGNITTGTIQTGSGGNASDVSINNNNGGNVTTQDITTASTVYGSSSVNINTFTGNISTGNIQTGATGLGNGNANVLIEVLEPSGGNIGTGSITTGSSSSNSSVFLSTPGTVTVGNVTTGAASSFSGVTFYGNSGVSVASVTTAGPFGPVDIEAINAGQVKVTGGITVAPGNTLFLQGGTGGVTVSGAITADDVFVDSAGSASLANTSNNIGIVDNSSVAGDFVLATSNLPTFGTVTAGSSFQWTAGTTGLTLDQSTFFDLVSAPLIRVTDNNALFSGITLNGPITPLASTLSLVSAGANGFISETTGNGISVASLNASAPIVTLAGPNSVSNLQGSASGSFQFTNTGPFSIATVDSTQPAGLSASSATLTAVGGIGQTAPVNVANLSISDSAGDITLLNSGNVIGSLTASSPTNVSVESGTGPMNVVSATAGTNLELISDSITASGPMTATNIFYTTANPAAVISPPSSFFSNVGSSRVDLQACKLEYSIVSPK